MKIVLNECFGGFEVSQQAIDLYGIEENDEDVLRTDERLIKAIEDRGTRWASTEFSKLIIVEIPDEATDWKIFDYDGVESLICVVDGKIKGF